MSQEQTQTTNEQSLSSASSAVNVPAVNDKYLKEISALREQLAARDAAFKALQLEQAGSDARNAFLKSAPSHVPEQYREALFDHAVAKGKLKIREDGWHWTGAKDPIQGAETFWSNYKTNTLEPVTLPSSSSTSISVPIQQQTISLHSFMLGE